MSSCFLMLACCSSSQRCLHSASVRSCTPFISCSRFSNEACSRASYSAANYIHTSIQIHLHTETEWSAVHLFPYFPIYDYIFHHSPFFYLEITTCNTENLVLFTLTKVSREGGTLTDLLRNYICRVIMHLQV